MKTCFGYIRVSTPKQGEGVSLEVQKADISDAALNRNLAITEWFVEIETAAKAGRPIFTKMAGRLKRGHAEALMVHKLDRSSRNMIDWGIVSALIDRGVGFYIATDPTDFSTRAGRLTADMLAVLAADFSRNQSEESKKGLRGRLKQGLFPYRSPIGYLKGGKGMPKPPCPIMGPLIKELFDIYASGQHSIDSAQIEMHRRGLRNQAGGTVSRHGIERILSNPFYHGQIVITRTGETFDGVHDPVITKPLYQKVQRLKSRRSGPKVTQHSHLFMGLFRCAHCKGALVPEKQRSNVYYRCHKPDCTMTSVREDWLDEAIREALTRLQLTPAAVAQMRADWDRSTHVDLIKQERKILLARIEDRQAKQGRLADLLLDDAIDRPTYKTKNAELIFELGQLRQDVDRLPDLTSIKQDREVYIRTMSKLVQLYDCANRCEKRQLLEQTFAIRTACKEGICLKVTEPGLISLSRDSEQPEGRPLEQHG